MVQDEQELKYAGFWIRAFASFVDSVILALVLIFVIVLTYFFGWMEDQYNPVIVNFLLKYILPLVIVILLILARKVMPREIYAGFRRRAFIAFIDTILVVLLATLVLIFTYYLSVAGDRYNSDIFNFLLTYVLPPAFIILFWIARQATPGKMILSIKIVDAETAKPPKIAQYIFRYLGYYVSIIPLGLGFLWVAIDKRKQGWHDKIANTLVIHNAKK